MHLAPIIVEKKNISLYCLLNENNFISFLVLVSVIKKIHLNPKSAMQYNLSNSSRCQYQYFSTHLMRLNNPVV